MRIFQNVILIFSVLILASCTSAPSGTPVPTGKSPTNAPASASEPTGLTPTGMPQVETVGTPTGEPAPGVTDAQSLSEKARQDLAQRLSLTVSDIHLISVAPITWPDTSLGCPQPDMAYAQMQTPGYVIKLSANDNQYEYHTDMGENMVDCENGVPAASGAPGVDALVEKAKQDLARRMSIPLAQISLVESGAVTWPDASLGCPQPDMMYAQVLTPGYRIVLSDGNKQYEYHAGHSQSGVFCANPKPSVP